MQLFIRRITGSVVIVEVDLATTIREMKAMIEVRLLCLPLVLRTRRAKL